MRKWGVMPGRPHFPGVAPGSFLVDPRWTRTTDLILFKDARIAFLHLLNWSFASPSVACVTSVAQADG